jgi:mannitol/fructose-specific phosphotransferase system IIA component (Ntr-type)
MISGERLLWQAVLDTALTDALRARFVPVELRRQLHWFRKDNPDFQMVCCFADSSPDTVRNLLMTLLKRGDEHDIRTFIRSARFHAQNDKIKIQKRRKRTKKIIN